MYKQVANSNTRLSTQSRWEQMYIDHITIQLKKIIHESRRMSEKVQTLIEEYYPEGSLGHSEEKVELSKKSLIIGKHKRLRLKQKLITGRMSILWSSKRYQNAARVWESGRGKLRLKRYNTKRY